MWKRCACASANLVNELPSHDAEVSVLFCDIRSFTAISERLAPDITMRWLRAVMHELSELIIDNEGVLVDFAGDEIMAMWGAPEAAQEHATRACNTAVQILERLPTVSAKWHEQIGVETDLAIGVNSGRAMVGHIGTARKTKYGPLGDTVNIGSRILGATAHLRTRLLISGQTRAAVDQHWTNGSLRRLCQVRMKNLAQSVELFELRPLSASTLPNDLTNRYEQALACYESQSLQQAAALLGQLLVDYPDDGPSLMLMSRVVAAMLDEDLILDTVWTLPSK
ncbi:MAG: adenylate cyclase [Gammaproteobacteria bacterium]